MSFGSRFTPVSFFTPAMPPFPANSADNGLSVDPVTGRIVLGNDVGGPGSPAQLLNDREIVTNDGVTTGDIVLTDTTAGATITQRLNASGTNILGANGSIISELRRVNLDFFNYHISGNGTIFWDTGLAGGLHCMTLTSGAGANQGKWQIGGPTNATKNPAACQVNGSISGQAMARTLSTGAINIDRTFDSNAIVINPNATGLVTVNLPSMAFSGITGFHLMVANTDILGITVQLPGGATINIGGIVSSAGGTLLTTTAGAFAHLYCVGSTSWFVGSFTGSWSVT